MKLHRQLVCLLSLCTWAAVGLLCNVWAADGVPIPTRSENDAATRKGFDEFYNLEYDKAIREFESAQQAHPDDPFAVNHTLAGVIFKELYRIGALDTEAYAADNFLTKKPTAPLDPKVHDRVKQLSDQALTLSQARLDKNPDDVDALYARGVTRGLRATYTGVAEKAWFSALRSAVAAVTTTSASWSSTPSTWTPKWWSEPIYTLSAASTGPPRWQLRSSASAATSRRVWIICARRQPKRTVKLPRTRRLSMPCSCGASRSTAKRFRSWPACRPSFPATPWWLRNTRTC